MLEKRIRKSKLVRYEDIRQKQPARAPRGPQEEVSNRDAGVRRSCVHTEPERQSLSESGTGVE